MSFYLKRFCKYNRNVSLRSTANKLNEWRSFNSFCQTITQQNQSVWICANVCAVPCFCSFKNYRSLNKFDAIGVALIGNVMKPYHSLLIEWIFYNGTHKIKIVCSVATSVVVVAGIRCIYQTFLFCFCFRLTVHILICPRTLLIIQWDVYYDYTKLDFLV